MFVQLLCSGWRSMESGKWGGNECGGRWLNWLRFLILRRGACRVETTTRCKRTWYIPVRLWPAGGGGVSTVVDVCIYRVERGASAAGTAGACSLCARCCGVLVYSSAIRSARQRSLLGGNDESNSYSPNSSSVVSSKYAELCDSQRGVPLFPSTVEHHQLTNKTFVSIP